MVFILSGCEVPGGESTRFIDNVNKDVCSIISKALAHWMTDQGLAEYFVGCPEGILVDDFNFAAGCVKGDEFYLFGTHDSSKAAASQGTDMVVRILNGDIGGTHLHLAGVADGHEADFVGESFFNIFNYGIIPLADNLFFCCNGNTVRGNAEGMPAVVFRLSFNDECFAAHSCKYLGRCAARVAFFDGAGERAF